MGIMEVKEASDDMLKSLGLDKAGDRLSLLSFCRQNNTNRRAVLNAFLTKPLSKSSKGKDKAKTRKIQLGWLNYDATKMKFQGVRLNTGGGEKQQYP